ncbi:MAG TPA: AMP-binding protein [Acidimicrobiales bacterium]|nr:AMP-binding protein [Acidimicrobiales bacterium]
MAMSYDEAVATVTGPGQVFELEEVEVFGVPTRVFKNAPATLRDFVASGRTRGDRDFLVYEDERWSFDLVMQHVDALSAALVEHFGVQKGDRVAIGMRNYPEWVVSWAAIVSIGAISVSLNAWWTDDEMDFALEDSGTTVLIADPERAKVARDSAQRLGIRTLVVRGEVPDAEKYDDVVVLGKTPPAIDIASDDDATILYTSGTTGRPKGAVSTHRAICNSITGFGARAALERLRNPETPRAATNDPLSFILIVPLFHVTGGVPVMLSCFGSGLKLVMMYKWDPQRALELIERERITSFVGVPTQSWDLLECPDFDKFDTSSLLSVGGGGAPAPPKLVGRVATSFKKAAPNIGYGMTETNAYGPGNSGKDYVEHPTSTGRAAPGQLIAIRDEDGKDLPVGERGEVWFRGPSLIRGYWNRPDATAETIVDGWLRSGDLGRVDDEGFLYIEDRAKDMILRAGENVYCAEVEAAIYEHAAVYEAAVFGVPHERLGEEVAAVVCLREGAELDETGLQAHVRERLAGFKVPTKVSFTTEALPRNPAGKILKRELRDQFSS